MITFYVSLFSLLGLIGEHGGENMSQQVFVHTRVEMISIYWGTEVSE